MTLWRSIECLRNIHHRCKYSQCRCLCHQHPAKEWQEKTTLLDQEQRSSGELSSEDQGSFTAPTGAGYLDTGKEMGDAITETTFYPDTHTKEHELDLIR